MNWTTENEQALCAAAERALSRANRFWGEPEVTAIKIQRYPANEQARTYHVRGQLTEQNIESVSKGGRDVSGIASLLFEIPGVASLDIRPYELSVWKAQAYDWEEIEPRVLEVLAPFSERP